MGAAGVAALQPLINATSVGWCFTLYAGISLLTVPLVLMLQAKSPAMDISPVSLPTPSLEPVLLSSAEPKAEQEV